MPRVGRISPAEVNEDEGAADDCETLLGSGGITRGGRQGVIGTAGHGLVGPTLRLVGASYCAKTVPKPYLFGWKGDQLRAKAEPLKTCNHLGGKGIVN
jgi:hypothetical protein